MVASSDKVELLALYFPAATYEEQIKVLGTLERKIGSLERTILLMSHQMWEVLDTQYEQALVKTVVFFHALETFLERTQFLPSSLVLVGTPRQHMPHVAALRITKVRDNFVRNWAELHDCHYIDHHRLAEETEVIPLVGNNWHHMCYIDPDVPERTNKSAKVVGTENGAGCDDAVNLAVIRQLFRIVRSGWEGKLRL